jgi:integrase
MLQEEQKLFAGSRWQEHNLIFPNSVGTPVDPSNLRVDFQRVLEKAGLPKLRFHDLRHTAASLLLNHGVPVIVVSNMLGHSKPSITLDVYGHLMTSLQGEAARIMDELVTPVPFGLPPNAHQGVSQGERAEGT